MQKIAFYLMNEKGLYTLTKFIKEFGSSNIKYVVSNRDTNIKKDYYDEIEELCKVNEILFFNKDKISIKKFSGYKFAIGWRWIIHNNRNLIVFHDSLLPKNRGFSPLVNSLINGNKKLGVTALFANSEYDKGNIIEQKSINIKYPIKINKAIKQIKPLYYQLVRNIYKDILNDNKIYSEVQNENNATYSMWLDKNDYFIDWKNWRAKKIKRFIDAVGYPFDNAKAYLNNNIVQLLDVEIVEDIKIENRYRHIGKVIFVKEGFSVIICKKGLIRIVDMRDEKNMKFKMNFRSRLY